ncbi:MAG: type II toxin-antitoxin system VapC family toxin [Candidatus Eremiobacteraeota bacterium]|nr:type II toxin-antitoxin system VapC family toxin [Candidatus Eremiobacteraeota bacterium]MBC5801605.1 type II toxin-antitoxin system VapC family toxin [Candidatus Eremiobacteraeota bacterium]MBC5821499.1 type II toxin-antitoxin system VapC family toxin [Candidatus Eremiobacteraeota bacterium]
MVLDTSALLAILFGEPSSDALIDAIAQAERRALSVASALEAVGSVRTADTGMDGRARCCCGRATRVMSSSE